MKTEKEAKELWCPHIRRAEIKGYEFFNDGNARVVSTNNGTLCIASRCMMWRWDHNKLVTGDYREGFCGLGGKPQ